jgi:Na+/proline symporter
MWLREAISDEKGQADMAYISIGGLILVMLGSIAFLCSMSAISYARCTQIVDVSKDQRAAVACTYDPNPLGLAIAACLGAFGSPIAALAMYMGQTRRREVPPASTVTTAAATVTTTETQPKPKRGGKR